MLDPIYSICYLRKTNFYDEIREFMKNMDFEGLDKGELPLSERNSADSRPPVSFE